MLLLNYKSVPKYSLERIFRVLPDIYRSFFGTLSEREKGLLSEIRIRADMPCAFTVGGENRIVSVHGRVVKSSRTEIQQIIETVCADSVYSFSDEISQGFVTFHSARIGIAGTSLRTLHKGADFSDITSINIRIPGNVPNSSREITDLIKKRGIDSVMGLLVVSPPNCGKTTLLRALAYDLSLADGDFALRVCLADERGELFMDGVFDNCFCDVYTGVPKAVCVEFAARTMSSQVIILDEIGNENEADSLLKVASCGVYIAASVHGNSMGDVMGRDCIGRLIKAGVFKTAYFLRRDGDNFCGTLADISRGEYI